MLCRYSVNEEILMKFSNLTHLHVLSYRDIHTLDTIQTLDSLHVQGAVHGDLQIL